MSDVDFSPWTIVFVVLTCPHTTDNSLQQHIVMYILTNSACKHFYYGFSSMGGLGFFSALSHTQFLDDTVIQVEDQLKEKGKVFF